MGSRIVAALLSVLTLMVLAGCGESYTEYGGIVQSVDLENQIIYSRTLVRWTAAQLYSMTA